MNKAGIFSRLDTVILRVEDLQKSEVWYKEKLGFSPGYRDEQEKLIVFDLGGTTSLTIYQLKPGEKLPRPGQGSATTFPIFLAEDASKTHEILKSRGVAVEAVQEGGGVRYFGFFDLNGNRLEVCQILKES